MTASSRVHFSGTNTDELIGTAGSRATSESGRGIQGDQADQLQRRVSTDLRDQLVKPFSALNIPAADLDLAPMPTWETNGEVDEAKRAEGLEAFGKALSAIKAGGYDVANVEEEAKKFGLILEKRDEPDPSANPKFFWQWGCGRRWKIATTTEMIRSLKKGEALAQLAAETAPQVDEVGRREGAIATQSYLDGLTNHLTDQAEALERIDSEAMLDIISAAKNPEDLKARLSEFAKDADPIELGQLFEKAILLSQLAGMYGSQEDL